MYMIRGHWPPKVGVGPDWEKVRYKNDMDHGPSVVGMSVAQ